MLHSSLARSEALIAMPRWRPNDNRFSSGPCKKHPGWTPGLLASCFHGRSHRAPGCKARLNELSEKSRRLLGMPADWIIGICPGSTTGAMNMALGSLAGSRMGDVLISDSFSRHWAHDLELMLPEGQVRHHEAPFGFLPAFDEVSRSHDLVLVYNGTNSGVKMPDLDWIDANRTGLVFCDGASAAFAMDIDFRKIDVFCCSWQKALGGEGGHGLIGFSPKAFGELQANARQKRPILKSFRLYDADGRILENFFHGHTISTPSLLAVEDFHSALDWAFSIGGLPGLIDRIDQNYRVIEQWVSGTDWINWVCENPLHRSPVSLCMRLAASHGCEADQRALVKAIFARLEAEGIAYDLFNYGNAPPGLRIWAGPTIETNDLKILTEWLDWAYSVARQERAQ